MFVQKNIAIYLRIGCVYCVTKVIYCVTGVQMSFFRHFSMELTQYLIKHERKKNTFAIILNYHTI